MPTAALLARLLLLSATMQSAQSTQSRAAGPPPVLPAVRNLRVEYFNEPLALGTLTPRFS